MAIACSILALDNSDCAASDGGIYQSYFVEATKVTDVTFSVDGEVTNFTMSTPGQWKKIVYDDDDTANYNQVGQRTGNKHTYQQTAFMKFAGMNNDKRKVAEGLTPCCQGVIAVHFLNNGEKVVQGIENISSLQDWKLAKKRAKATVNANTDTGAGEDRFEFSLISEAKTSSPFTTLEADDIEAL